MRLMHHQHSSTFLVRVPWTPQRSVGPCETTCSRRIVFRPPLAHRRHFHCRCLQLQVKIAHRNECDYKGSVYTYLVAGSSRVLLPCPWKGYTGTG